MKNKTQMSSRALMAAGLASVLICSPARAQLLANFQAGTYTGGSTWTDSEGVVATANGTPVLNTSSQGDSITTTNGAFSFNADSVSGLAGLTSYTVAVGFTYASPYNAPGSGTYYQGSGVFGGDIGGAGQGDTGIAIGDGSENNTGAYSQVVSTNGNGSGGDTDLYGVQSGGHNYQYGATDYGFVVGQPTGVVLVANGSAGTLSLYVNGYLDDTEAWNPIAFGTGSGGTYRFAIGETSTAGLSNLLSGDITQAQIYGSALNSTDAESLSLAIAADSAPEPTTWAMLAGGLFVLGAVAHFRRRSQVL